MGLLLAIIGGIYFYFSTSDEQKRRDELVVGTNVGYPPYVFTSEEGDIIGFDVDLARAIAQKLQKTLVLRSMSFDALIIAVKQARVDMIMGGISITPSREKEIALLPYHGDDINSFSLLFWEQVPPGIAQVRDIVERIKEPVIATQEGTTMADYLEQFADKASIKVLGDIDELVMDIRYGKSIAALVETPVAYKLQQMNPLLKVVTFSLNKEYRYAGDGIGFSKGNTVLLDSVRRVMEKMKSSGEMKLLTDKWFGER